jgi:hypothetical protein
MTTAAKYVILYFGVGSRVVRDDHVKHVMYQLNTLNLNGNHQNLIDTNILHCIFTAFGITVSFIVMKNMQQCTVYCM